MLNRYLFFLLFFFSISGCGIFKPISSVAIVKSVKVKEWELHDNGEIYPIEIKIRQQGNRRIYEHHIFTNSKERKLIERVKTISRLGKLRKSNLNILRPQYSFMEVWIDKVQQGAVYKLNPKEASFNVVVQNEVGLRKEQVVFPKRVGLFCFSSQVVECLRVTGFFKKALKYRNGLARLNVIWEGAYTHYKIYEYYPKEVFTPATFEYVGLSKEGLYKFALNFKDQIIIYLLDRDFKLYSWSWATIGVELTPKVVEWN